MSSHHYSHHLDGDEIVRTSAGMNHDALYVEDAPTSTGLVLPHSIAPADRIRFLRELSEAASDLADEINLRDLEAAS
jgi:hypothetical protein